MTATRRGLSLGVTLLLAGGVLALLASSQTWLTATVRRARPLPDVVVHLHGRTVQPAVVGIGLAALAAAVALIATAGSWRRGVGAVVTLAGVALIWCSVLGIGAGDGRVAALVAQQRTGSVLNGTELSVRRAYGWPLLCVAAGMLVAAAGLFTAALGHRWAGMSSRYEAPARTSSASAPAAATPEDRDRARSVAAAALWNRVDRGEDPTLDPTFDPTLDPTLDATVNSTLNPTLDEPRGSLHRGSD